jgi:hypothetical protein
MASKTVAEIRAAIDNRFPSNVIKQITAERVRNQENDIVDALLPQIGIISTDTPSADQTVGTTSVSLDGFTDNDQVGTIAVPNFSTDRITVNDFGLFKIIGRVSLEFNANRVLDIEVLKNGVSLGYAVKLSGGGTGKPVAVTFPGGPVSLISGDYVSIGVKLDASSTIQLINGFFQLERIPFGV